MKASSAAYDELVYGGHLLALGTSGIAASVTFVMGRTPSWDLLLMAYLFSFGAYSINRASDFDQDRLSHPSRTAYLQRRRGVLPAVAAASFLLGYGLALFRNIYFFAALLIPLSLALAYSVSSERMASATGISRLKEGILTKNVAISSGWALIPLLVGLYYFELPKAILVLAPFVFLRLMVNTIFFDQRDIEADAVYGVKTLPGRLGLAGSARVMNLLDMASGLYIISVAAVGLVPYFAAGLAGFTLYSVAYRWYASSGKHVNSVRDLVADGEYVLWGVVTYIGHL